MARLGGEWAYVNIAAEMERRGTERQTQESIKLAAEIRDLTSQLRWLTWVVVVLGGIAAVAAILALARPG